MNRKSSSLPTPPSIFVESLEPRIAPASLLNEAKFTSVVVGGTVLLDASGGATDFQGLSTSFGTGGSYLLYLTAGKALVYTTDLNGDGKFEPGEITGIALAPDSLGRPPSLILFSDVHGDIATNLLPGHGVSALTDSNNNPNDGRDGRVLLPTSIDSITLRTITQGDLNPNIPGDTQASRLSLTSFSIYGNIYVGGNFGGLSIDTSGVGALTTKFSGLTGTELYTGSTPQIGSILTGSAASGQTFHFTQNSTNNVEGPFQNFAEPVGLHGSDISNISAVNPATAYSIGTLQTGVGAAGERGGNISNVVLNGATGSYELITGDGGSGAAGGDGGSIINFNDLGSVTGQVILHTGAGGTGLLGPGGAGGTATFATTKISASVEVLLGNGGDGFSSGGNGASLPSVVLTAPEPILPIGSKFLGTWHDLGDIGNTHRNADGTYSPDVINFNAPSYFSDPVLASTLGDAYGDGVFTTNTPGQIEVVFGDGVGGLQDNGGAFNLIGSVKGPETVYLHVPGVVNPVVTIGDFNGDGRPDIAVASSSANNFSGIYVFLNQIGTPLDPINAHNFLNNPLGDHPFSEAMQTAIPSLTDFLGVFVGPGAVLALTSGDFNGDGITDIGLVQHVTGLNGGSFQAIGVLFGDAAHDATGQLVTHSYTNLFDGSTVTRNAGTGYFYANSAAPAAAATLQFDLLLDNANVSLKATSLVSGNNIGTGTTPHSLAAPEVFFYVYQQSKTIDEALVTLPDPITHKPLLPVLSLLGVSAGEVDTNRGPMVNTAGVTVQDFVIVDLDNNGAADIVILSQSPVQFITTLIGDGTGDFTLGSINPASPGNNDGIFLGTKSNATVIVGVDLVGDGQFNEFGLLEFGPATPIIQEIQLPPGPGLTVFYSDTPTFLNVLDVPSLAEDKAVQGMDAFYIDSPVPGALHPITGYGLVSPDTSDVLYSDVFIVTDAGTVYARFFTENGYFVNAGSGGNSTIGPGGSGGSIGTPTLTLGAGGDVSGQVQIVFPMSIDFAGEAFLLAGSGGNGFAGGGNGGSVEGVTIRYAAGTAVNNSDAVLSAGNGGNSLAGPGGIGGNIDHDSITSGSYFSAGNGGNGVSGGMGGSITGNGVSSIFDTTDGNATLTPAEALAIGLNPNESTVLFGVGLGAGNGGQGSVVGGTGGSISNWDAIFNNVVEGIGGAVYYASGVGGNAAAGTGGNGGSITNSSPNVDQNNLSDNLHLQTGAGGSGLTGGDGGAITTFINQPTNQDAVAAQLSVITGGGGTGVIGNGGVGGSITAFQSNATGLNTFLVEATDGALFGLGRVIAGDGGASFGGQGGDGGVITKITAQTTSTPIIVAAGAGGAGLTIGGEGGSVTGSIINSAAQQIGKVLIVSGIGGDASSALTTQIILPGDTDTNDLAHAVLAFGGAAARAGDGGDISQVTQPISVQTAVDLIAGNGGSTLNAGTSLDPATGVGRGGSVVDVNLTGTVGAISRNSTLGVPANPPIQAYATTDALGVSQTLPITALIDLIALPDNEISTFRDTVNVAEFGSISGNVGIVAGSAGRVRNDQPARDGLPGSVQNITAESIMSIVAGSVSSVAPVNILSGITVTDPDGVLGADRRTTPPFGPNGVLDYFNPDGIDVPNDPIQVGDSLVNADGALFAIMVEQTSGTVLIGPRVFHVLP